MPVSMNTPLDFVAKLCENCEQGALFRDDQDFLYETIDAHCRPILAQSGENAVRVTPAVLLRDDILPELSSLADSAQKGCDFCGFLRSIILAKDTQQEIEKIFGSSFTDVHETYHISVFIHFRWKYESEQDCRGNGLLGAIISLCFDDGTEIALLCVAEGFTGREVSDIWLGLNTLSNQDYYNERRINWMVKMLDQDPCAEGGGETFIPERLISVEGHPRLVLRTDPDGYGSATTSYAALSYCWGTADDAKRQLTTTTASIADRKKGIQDHEMTSVLNDAIRVTRALKIPYLWIDSLCILQDDISDWERQCADVGLLYAHAVVTICAASSSSCQEGFLRQRGLRIRVPFRSVKRPDISGFYYLQFKWSGVAPSEIISEDVADSTHSRWGNRGWVYQESTCASRKFVFGNSNVHYYSTSSVVQTMDTCEKRTTNTLPLSLLRSKSDEEIYRSWASVLREYARFEDLSFTSIADVLPALSGLAAYYYKRLHTEYHAGLWKGDLFRGLMWSCDGNSESLPSRDCCLPSLSMRHNGISLPSWSPLGRGMLVNHAVYKDNHGFTDYRPEYYSLEAKTTPIGQNRFGKIKGDWCLKIHSNVLQMKTLDAKRLDIADIFDEFDDSRGILSYNGKQIGHFELDFSYRESQDNSPTGSPARKIGEISRFSWVLLGSCKVRNDGDPRGTIKRARGACGLVLYSAANSNIFFRVGIFYPAFPNHHHDGLSLLKNLGERQTITIR